MTAGDLVEFLRVMDRAFPGSTRMVFDAREGGLYVSTGGVMGGYVMQFVTGDALEDPISDVLGRFVGRAREMLKPEGEATNDA